VQMAVDTTKTGNKAEAVSEQEMQGAIPRREYIPNPFPADVKWGMVYHRIQYGREHGRPCDCKGCEEYLAHIHEKYYWTEVAGA
jgi:hypothetical protein